MVNLSFDKPVLGSLRLGSRQLWSKLKSPSDFERHQKRCSPDLVAVFFGEVVEWPEWPIGSIPQRLGIRSLGKVFGDVWGPANVMQTRRPILTLW